MNKLKICVIKDNNKNPSAIINKLKSKHLYKVYEVDLNESFNGEDYDVIIPVGIENTRFSTQFTNSLYSDSNLIKNLDDKAKINNYINDDIIPSIPTLNLKHASDLDIKKFVNDNTDILPRLKSGGSL